MKVKRFVTALQKLTLTGALGLSIAHNVYCKSETAARSVEEIREMLKLNAQRKGMKALGGLLKEYTSQKDINEVETLLKSPVFDLEQAEQSISGRINSSADVDKILQLFNAAEKSQVPLLKENFELLKNYHTTVTNDADWKKKKEGLKEHLTNCEKAYQKTIESLNKLLCKDVDQLIGFIILNEDEVKEEELKASHQHFQDKFCSEITAYKDLKKKDDATERDEAKKKLNEAIVAHLVKEDQSLSIKPLGLTAEEEKTFLENEVVKKNFESALKKYLVKEGCCLDKDSQRKLTDLEEAKEKIALCKDAEAGLKQLGERAQKLGSVLKFDEKGKLATEACETEKKALLEQKIGFETAEEYCKAKKEAYPFVTVALQARHELSGIYYGGSKISVFANVLPAAIGELTEEKLRGGNVGIGAELHGLQLFNTTPVGNVTFNIGGNVKLVGSQLKRPQVDFAVGAVFEKTLFFGIEWNLLGVGNSPFSELFRFNQFNAAVVIPDSRVTVNAHYSISPGFTLSKRFMQDLQNNGKVAVLYKIMPIMDAGVQFQWKPQNSSGAQDSLVQMIGKNMSVVLKFGYKHGMPTSQMFSMDGALIRQKYMDPQLIGLLPQNYVGTTFRKADAQSSAGQSQSTGSSTPTAETTSTN